MDTNSNADVALGNHELSTLLILRSIVSGMLAEAVRSESRSGLSVSVLNNTRLDIDSAIHATLYSSGIELPSYIASGPMIQIPMELYSKLLREAELYGIGIKAE